jgi:hypothetical protein
LRDEANLNVHWHDAAPLAAGVPEGRQVACRPYVIVTLFLVFMEPFLHRCVPRLRLGAHNEMPDRDTCRRAAAECMELAMSMRNENMRVQLIKLAGKFLDLSSRSGGADAFRALIDEFNDLQMRK